MDQTQAVKNDHGGNLPVGSHHYRAFVGPPQKYDLVAATQFNLLTALGLREHNLLLDIGCGSLRAGRLFIPYLLPGCYFGIEPEQWLLREGIENELGQDCIRLKNPLFSADRNFTLSVFDRKFDFLMAQSIFSHASPRQISKCLTEASTVMTSDSMFAATFVEGNDDYLGEDWVYPGCVAYRKEFISRLVEESGLVCTHIDWPHPNDQRWVLITHPANDRVRSPDIFTGAQGLYLRDRLQDAEDQLSKIKNHPYVRFGLVARRLLQFGRRER